MKAFWIPIIRALWSLLVITCTLMGHKLYPIHNVSSSYFRYIQAFIASELADREGNWWIGLSNTDPQTYKWTSGQKITYTNWDVSHTGELLHFSIYQHWCSQLYPAGQILIRYRQWHHQQISLIRKSLTTIIFVIKTSAIKIQFS